jgi:hypothetical protein
MPSACKNFRRVVKQALELDDKRGFVFKKNGDTDGVLRFR